MKKIQKNNNRAISFYIIIKYVKRKFIIRDALLVTNLNIKILK